MSEPSPDHVDLNARLKQMDRSRMSPWALAGVGSGELTLKQEGDKPMPTDISMRMGAVGVKGQVLDGTGASGVALNVKSDAMWVGTKSERTADMVATEGDVTRLRLIREGERTFEAGNGGTFTPSGQIGLRHDGGDAETGAGIEVGAGLRYSVGAVTVEAQARALLAHEASGWPNGRGYEEVWRASMRHGEGIVTEADGVTCRSAWRWGNLVPGSCATGRDQSEHDARNAAGNRKYRGNVSYSMLSYEEINAYNSARDRTLSSSRGQGERDRRPQSAHASATHAPLPPLSRSSASSRNDPRGHEPGERRRAPEPAGRDGGRGT